MHMGPFDDLSALQMAIFEEEKLPKAKIIKKKKEKPFRSHQELHLLNGNALTDSPPGEVVRNHPYAPGAWIVARILLYIFTSFPRLWTRGGAYQAEADDNSFQYNWNLWIKKLDKEPKSVGSWRQAAIYLLQMGSDSVTHKTVTDAVKAVIELALRDAEFERRATSSMNEQYSWSVHETIAKERNFMARVRSTITYKPRSARIERFLYEAIDSIDTSFTEAIAAKAPTDNPVHDVIRSRAF